MKSEIESYLESVFGRIFDKTHHSLIITNQHQSSLDTSINWLAERLTSRSSDITRIVPDGASIKIHQVRPLYRLAHHRRENNSRRVIAIDQAGVMSLPAQNALLKLLEEPPTGVVFLLGATDLSLLTPTIGSRSQIIDLPRVDKAKFSELFLGDNQTTRERRYQLSQGDPLLASDIEQLSATIDQAKRFFSLPISELVLETNKLNPSREQVQAWCHALSLICKAAINSAKSTRELKAWLNRSEVLIQAQTYLGANVSHKLTLKWLLLEIRH